MVNMQEKNIKELFAQDVRSFSIYDCQRSLPSGIDGFKPSMRKIIYGMLKKFPDQEIKVSLASAGISEVSCYHHGSLEGTLVNMAQSFTGSNNVPFLEDIGQFGSRISPAASAGRYIFTKLSDSFRKIFLKDDDLILVQQEDDGQKIEPEYYLPIIPTILLNGTDGMGTGFACKILNYNPNHLIRACEEVIKKGSLKNDLVPWYKGFTGTIEKNNQQTVFTGCYTIENTTTIKITELPVGSFTQKYRDHLNDLEDKNLVKSYVDNSSEEKTEFVVTCPRETLRKTHEELLKVFKLVSRETENFTVWNENNRLKKFDSAKELIEWFVKFRLTKYEERRQALITVCEERLARLNERKRFIEFYLKRTAWFSVSKKADIIVELEIEKFTHIDDLMSIRVYNLTGDEIVSLVERIQLEQENLEKLQNTTGEQLYLEDLSKAKSPFKGKQYE
jgi:DNA topoisomerase II